MAEKYILKGISCSGCAARIGQTIKDLPGVEGASIDMDESVLTVYGIVPDLQIITGIVQKIEPGVEVERLDSAKVQKEKIQGGSILSSLGERDNLIELGQIMISAVLFAVGLLFAPFFEATPWSAGYYAVFGAAYITAGWTVIRSAFGNILNGNLFDEFFLMTLATFAAIALGFLGEAVGVMLFYRTGEFLQELAASRSRRSIKSLLASKPVEANLLKDGQLEKVSPETVKVGEVILVKPGEKIPLDGRVLSGNSQVDTSPLTGEPVPVRASEGKELYAGTVNLTGNVELEVTSAYRDTTIARVLEMVEFAVSQKSPTERFITRFAKYYTPSVVMMAVLVAIVPPLAGFGTFGEWIYRALVLLIISCPCALVVSIPLGYFGGIGAASKSGLLVKGGNVLDALNGVKTVIFDKTGTLTQGVFKVTSVVPAEGVNEEELLENAALAELHSNHPIARSILEACKEKPSAQGMSMQEIPGNGIRAEQDGSVILAGKASLLVSEGIEVPGTEENNTVVHVARNGKYLGYLVISDVIREDARQAIANLRKIGIEAIYMLTGDIEKVASSVSSSLGLDGYRAGLLPDQKVSEVERIIEERGGKVLFAGDGINDAPSLATAHVGVAMGGLGSAAAVETADLVILSDRPSEIADAITIAGKTRRIVWENIFMALGVKAVIMAMGLAGIAGLWEAIFADVGVALLAVLNSTRTIGLARSLKK
jgi:Cd2+/Zn2+-exporting ATPase